MKHLLYNHSYSYGKFFFSLFYQIYILSPFKGAVIAENAFEKQSEVI